MLTEGRPLWRPASGWRRSRSSRRPSWSSDRQSGPLLLPITLACKAARSATNRANRRALPRCPVASGAREGESLSMNEATKISPRTAALVSSIWPLVVPLAFYVQLAGRIGRQPPFASTALPRVGYRAVLVVVAVSLLLSLMTCWYLSWRQSEGVTSPSTNRASAGVALFLGFALSPWLAAAAVAGSAGASPIELWVMPGVFQRAIPCVSAALAGFSYLWLTRRR